MNTRELLPRLAVFPTNTGVNQQGHLIIGGCDVLELAAKYGTPLFLFEETGLREKCREFQREFSQRYANQMVVYAGKAFLNKAMARLLDEEGLGLDVVSSGEASIAAAGKFPLQRAFFHGNNKSPEELRLALQWGIGHIVVDNFDELALLDKTAGEMGKRPLVLLRLTPGVDPHTHQYLATGVIDSKFGFPMVVALEAANRALAFSHLDLIGLHCHIGSSIFETSPYLDAIDNMLNFAAEAKSKSGFEMKILDIGGGFAVQYVIGQPTLPVAAYAEAITSRVKAKCHELKLALPRLVIEPGRSIVARSGVALYTVGAIKEVPGVRRFACVDGGMGDNIRPALYDAKYEALLANRADEPDVELYTIAGKYCESGDILIRDIKLPQPVTGDILAIPVCGAYCIPMASNYNASLKPAIVMVHDGNSRLIRRRETFTDLISTEVD